MEKAQVRSRRCPVHDGQVHGKEAAELRRGIEELLDEGTGQISRRALQWLLDRVDARDSLAHEEARLLSPQCFEPEEPEYDTSGCSAVGVGGRHSEAYSEEGEWVCDFCGARPRAPVTGCRDPRPLLLPIDHDLLTDVFEPSEEGTPL